MTFIGREPWWWWIAFGVWFTFVCWEALTGSWFLALTYLTIFIAARLGVRWLVAQAKQGKGEAK